MTAKRREYKISSRVFLYPGMDAWHFIGIPKEQSEEIKKDFGAIARGWGSLPVTVMVGTTTWTTSIFPDKQSGTYLLPLKAAVRKREAVQRDDVVTFVLTINS